MLDRMFKTNGQIIYESISGNDKRNFHLTKMFSLTKVLDLFSCIFDNEMHENEKSIYLE